MASEVDLHPFQLITDAIKLLLEALEVKLAHFEWSSLLRMHNALFSTLRQLALCGRAIGILVEALSV